MEEKSSQCSSMMMEDVTTKPQVGNDPGQRSNSGTRGHRVEGIQKMTKRQADGLENNLRVGASDDVTYHRLALNVNNDQNTHGTRSCRADVLVHNVVLDAIIDTGAVRTMLSYAVYEKFRRLLGVLDLTDVTLMSASGDKCKLAGEVTLPFQLRGVSYTQKVLVAHMKSIELLVGMDFLYKSGAVIDLQNNQLLLPNQRIPLRSRRLAGALPVRLSIKNRVGPWREGGLACICENWPDGQPALFESMVNVGREIAFADAVVEPVKGCFTLPLRNYTSSPAKLEGGLCIGSLTQIATHITDGVECLAIFEPSIVNLHGPGIEESKLGPVWAPRGPGDDGSDICMDGMRSPLNCEAAGGPLSTAAADKCDDASVGGELESCGVRMGQPVDSTFLRDSNPRGAALRAGCPEHIVCALPEGG